MFHLCTPWKDQKASFILIFSGGGRSGTLVETQLKPQKVMQR